jgi:hypothetical protein
MKIKRIAEKLGYRYEPVPWFGAWYEILGFHTKDYIFDRFEPQNTPAKILKNIAQTIWFLFYIVPFGLWLTTTGLVITSGVNWLKKILGLRKERKIERQRIA